MRLIRLLISSGTTTSLLILGRRKPGCQQCQTMGPGALSLSTDFGFSEVATRLAPLVKVPARLRLQGARAGARFRARRRTRQGAAITVGFLTSAPQHSSTTLGPIAGRMPQV